MQTATLTKPLALRNLRRVDVTQSQPITPINDWSWSPLVNNPEKLKNIIASGDRTTSRSTFSNQTDHGEAY